MRRRFVASILIFVMLASTIATGASSTAEINSLGRIESYALAINDAQVNPQQDTILAVGDEGYSVLIDFDSPGDAEKRTVLDSGRNSSLNSVGWHVGGKTAFIAGENGVVLRYVESSGAIENVDGTGALEGTDINAIEWRNNGDRAYLGGEAGRIYSYDAENGFQLIDQTAGSDITSISCHRHHSVCIVTTLQDGIAIIDRDSQVSWHGSSSDTWLDSICSDSDVNECVIIASGRRVSVIILKPDDIQSSIVEPAEVIGDLSGEFTGISNMRDNSITISLAPYGIIEYKLDNRKAYQLLDHEDVKNSELELSDTNLVHVWGDDLSNGHTLSSDGNIGEISPTLIGESDLMTKAMMILVAISVPGCVLGLIFMNSKTLQNWYLEKRKSRRRKAAEKARAAARKKNSK